MQVAELTLEPLGFPEGSVRLLIVITIAGFPVVFLLAWILDIKSKGVIFDLPLWQSGGTVTRQQRRASRPMALFLCLIVLLVTWWLVLFLLDVIEKPEENVQVQEQITQANEQVLLPNSIAVLAFENFDGNDETDYFADGLSEEILNYLSSVRELNVAARTSSFRFRREQMDVREISKLLNVAYVLEGSVRRDGDRVRINAQLIDGARGFNAWSRSYDRDIDDIFAIQREISTAVVNELKIALSIDARSRMQSNPSESIDAYIYYLQGLEKLRSSEDQSRLQTAKQLFNQALDIDSEFSRAYAGICEANLQLYETSNSVIDFSNAETACEQAQSLGDASAEVMVALGRLYRFRGLYPKAQSTLEEAIAVSPNASDAYIELAELQFAQNELVEAEATFKRAIDLKRNYWKAHESLANFYYVSERYEEAIERYNIVTRLTPDSAIGFNGLGSSYWMLGEVEQALSSYERALSLSPSRQAYTNLGMFYYYNAQFEEAVSMQVQALEFANDDHRVWGRLAESYRFVPGKASEADFAYKRAVDLARSNLAINEQDWFTRAILGLYLAHVDEVNEGLDLIEQAIEQSQRNPEVLYFYALALLLDERSPEAIESLKEAMSGDPYYRLFINRDPDFKALKGQPDFEALLN